MTIYAIEVRAIAEQYDILARQVAREILELFDSGGSQRLIHRPPSVRTAQLYHLTGKLSPSQIDQLTRNLLVDAVTQQAINKGGDQGLGTRGHPYPVRSTRRTRIGYGRGLVPALGVARKADSSPPWTIIDVFFRHGVTDTLAESVITGASMLGIDGIERVATGRRYYLDGSLSADEVRLISESLLYNPVIQQYELYDVRDEGRRATARVSTQPPNHPRPYNERSPTPAVVIVRAGAEEESGGDPCGRPGDSPYVPLTTMTDDQLLELSKRGLLALNLDEMRAIKRHFQEERREPTDVELETLAQTWSEHCSHKTFKATIEYREVDGNGGTLEQETINGLLKSYIMRATEQAARPWVVSAFSDNAGIVRFTETQDIAFKVETHNHPSAIEPFGGANTGVGGVIRDVLGVSAQPIACTDILCFGPPDTPPGALPVGILAPRRVAAGVVDGVRDYGNKMGIPTVNGALLYHPGYIFNPLVFCGCLGILPRGSHPRRAQPGDRIVVLGGRTGRDGIHGATFSSGEMSSEINAQAGSAVQIGAPITEKKVTDVIIQARDRQLYSAITDCGAGGFSSAIGEMGAETGAYVELEKAPLKYQGLTTWEIWLSEAQERMVLAVPPHHLEALLEICAVEEVEASIIGTFADNHRLVVTYHGQIAADLAMAFLHEGRPGRTLEAVWTREVNPRATARVSSPPNPTPAPTMTTSSASDDTYHSKGGGGVDAGRRPLRSPSDLNNAVLTLLRHPTIGSKEAVVRRYDHEVQGATALKPLVGRAGNGPGDAAILQPILSDVGAQFIAPLSCMGIVLSNGINPLYGHFDPYWMAMNAVDEALRNLTAVGGDIERAALLDNFCWGNPTDPAQLGMLVRAVKGCHDAAVGFGTPFISGKDSLNNEYRADGQRLPVIPTLLISAVGVIDDAACGIDMSLKQPGNLLYLAGKTRNELAGSHYCEISLAESRARAGTSPARTLLRNGRIGYGWALAPSPWPRPWLPGFETSVPHVDIETARMTMNAVGQAIRGGLVEACHDLSEGGLAVAAAEMALAGLLGLSIDIEQAPRESFEVGNMATIL
ncbi:MAG TPA: phosphoribosylformylglycinamidine synthase subunit PurS, partial [Ktedonobacteraceae bacterium]|nr:phosphoribosylformylglycinamidine synthase subunit PurS [Ktedonobacteraceae bacterium]